MGISPMPNSISLSLPLSASQTLASSVSCLAAENGLRSAERFCIGVNIDPKHLARGDETALSILAAISGVFATTLEQAGTWPTPAGYRHAGERLDRDQLRIGTHVCPQCVAEDRVKARDRNRYAAPWVRASWLHGWVTACSHHGLALVPLPRAVGTKAIHHDLAAQLRAFEDDGNCLPYVPAQLGPAAHYVEQRLLGKAGDPILDEMDLSDALFVAQYLGAAQNNGKRTLHGRSENEIIECAASGLSIIAQGCTGIESRLREIGLAMNPHGACEVGLRPIFQDLYRRVEGRSGHDMAMLRKLLVQIGLEQNLFVHDQQEALGLQLPQRSAETIEHARRRFGISDRIMRAVLEELGILANEEKAKPSNAVLVRLDDFEPILRNIKGCLNLANAASYLGLHPQQLVKLSNYAGIIEPFFTRPSTDLKPLRYFRVSDLEELMTRLTSRCRRVKSQEGLLDIWEAGLQTCRQPSAVIAAIHDGRIVGTFAVKKVANLRDLLVAPEDVRTALADEIDDEVLSAEDCARSLSINLTAMRKILRSGLIKSRQVANPINRRPQMVVERSDLETFAHHYVSLSGIRAEYVAASPILATDLTGVGVYPAFPLHQSMVGLYSRVKVDRAWPRLKSEQERKAIAAIVGR